MLACTVILCHLDFSRKEKKERLFSCCSCIEKVLNQTVSERRCLRGTSPPNVLRRLSLWNAGFDLKSQILVVFELNITMEVSNSVFIVKRIQTVKYSILFLCFGVPSYYSFKGSMWLLVEMVLKEHAPGYCTPDAT